MGVKTQTNLPNIHLSFRNFAGPWLLLAAAAALMPLGRANADDTVDYLNTVRYYETLSPSATPAPARRPAPRLGFVQLERRASELLAPARVIVLGRADTAAPRTREGDGHFIVFPNAEATGAAQGQTVNRAINDLN